MKYMLKSTGPAIIVVALIIVLVVACNEAPTDSELTPTYGYELSGLIVRDINVDSIRAQAWLNRDGASYDSAKIAFGGDSLRWNVDRYRWAISPYSVYAPGNYTLSIIDSGLFSGAYSGQLIANFACNITDPANRQLPGGGTVSLEWAGAQGAQSYAMAAVLKDSVYTESGYSEWAASGATAGTIPRDAFLGVGDNVVPGTYYIYVYGYSGAPDSVTAGNLIPTHLPSRLPTNVTGDDFSGRFGMISVTLHDSVEVLAE